MEMLINQQSLISSYMRYLTAHGRYLDALTHPDKPNTIAYAQREFEETHEALLRDGDFLIDQTPGGYVARVFLPAVGRIDGSRVMDLPQFRFFIDHQRYGSGLFQRDSRGEWQPVVGDVELFEHVIELNEDGDGYCLLYDDHVVNYLR